MTNKQRAMARVAGFLAVCTVAPLVTITILNTLAQYYTVGQIMTGFGIGLTLVTLVGVCKMLYEIELNKLDTVDKLKGTK
jgi:hypothetical protein